VTGPAAVNVAASVSGAIELPMSSAAVASVLRAKVNVAPDCGLRL